jgi:hypothetical protein
MIDLSLPLGHFMFLNLVQIMVQVLQRVFETSFQLGNIRFSEVPKPRTEKPYLECGYNEKPGFLKDLRI